MKKLILIISVVFIACCGRPSSYEVENLAPLTGDLKDCKMYYIERISGYVVRCPKEKCVTETHKVGKTTRTTTTCESE